MTRSLLRTSALVAVLRILLIAAEHNVTQMTKDVFYEKTQIAKAYQLMGHARLITKLDFTDIIRMHNETLNSIQQSIKVCFVAYGTNTNRSYAQNFATCNNYIHDELSELNFQPMYNRVTRQARTLQLLFSHDLHKIIKRSLLPFVGNVYSVLFGIGTESEIAYLNDTIEILQNNQQKLLQYERSRYSWINNSFSALLTESRESYRRMLEVHSNVTRELYKQIEDNQMKSLIQHLVDKISLILLQISNQLEEIFLFLDFAKSHQIFEPFLDVDSILKQLQAVSKGLPQDNFIPAYSTDKNILTLLRLAEVEYYKKEDGIIVDISFPIARKDSLYDIISYTPIAQRIGKDSNIFHYFPVQHEMYIKDKQNTDCYGMTDLQFQSSCRKLNEFLYICDIKTSLTSKNTKLPIDLNETKPLYFKLTEPLLVQSKQQFHYILYGPQDGRVTIFDDGKVTDVITDCVYSIYCSRNCLIHTHGKTIKTREPEVQSNRFISSVEYIHGPNLTMNVLDFAKITLQKPDAYLIESELDPFQTFSRVIEEQPNIEDVHLETKMHETDWIKTYLPQTNFGLILLGIIVILIIFFIWKCRKHPSGVMTNVVIPSTSTSVPDRKPFVIVTDNNRQETMM